MLALTDAKFPQIRIYEYLSNAFIMNEYMQQLLAHQEIMKCMH